MFSVIGFTLLLFTIHYLLSPTVCEERKLCLFTSPIFAGNALYIDPNPVNSGGSLILTETGTTNCSTFITDKSGGGYSSCSLIKSFQCTGGNPKDGNPCWDQWQCVAGSKGNYTATFGSYTDATYTTFNPGCGASLAYTVRQCEYSKSSYPCDSCPPGWSVKQDLCLWSDGSGVCTCVSPYGTSSCTVPAALTCGGASCPYTCYNRAGACGNPTDIYHPEMYCPVASDRCCETPIGPVCGNGIPEAGEACDNGASNGACPATCSTSCTINSCAGTCPAMTCSYSQLSMDPSCPIDPVTGNRYQVVTGTGCSGFNCSVCNYIGGCSTISCYTPPKAGTCITNDPAQLSDIVCVIKNIIGLLAPAAAIAFFVMLVIGGFQFISSGGDPKSVGHARTTLTIAVLGIILVVVSWLILTLIRAITSVDVTTVRWP